MFSGKVTKLPKAVFIGGGVCVTWYSYFFLKETYDLKDKVADRTRQVFPPGFTPESLTSLPGQTGDRRDRRSPGLSWALACAAGLPGCKRGLNLDLNLPSGVACSTSPWGLSFPA